MTTTTYTVLNTDGEPIGRHLSAIEAASEILSHDGAEWELRHEDGAFVVWTRQQVASIPWSPTSIFSVAESDKEALEEIAAVVINKCRMWRHSPSVMTDGEYDALVAELEAERAIEEAERAIEEAERAIEMPHSSQE